MYVKANPGTLSFEDGSSYFTDGFDHEHLIKTAEFYINKCNIDFDSFVCLGISSMIAAPVLAYHFKVPFLALRKPDVRCHDRNGIGAIGRGNIGKRWLFVDDFRSSGQTIKNAISYVNKGLEYLGFENYSEYVGTLTYNRNGSFIDPDSNSYSYVLVSVDGHTTGIDTNVYNNLRMYYGDARYRKQKDPKGYAISTLKRYNEEKGTSMKDLAAAVVQIAKDQGGS